MFFANRVCEILEHTSVDEWPHVASDDNPADAGTRGMPAKVLQSSRWVQCPDLLRTKQIAIVPSPEVVNNNKIVKQPKKMIILTHCWPHPQRGQ